MTIIAAADGSALGNPGPAGWAWYVNDDCWRAGGWPHGTNNQGELMAVLDLFRATAHLPDEDLRILCDSQYVINSVTKWMPGWKRKGWRKSDGKPVLNVELLKDIDREIAGRKYIFEWVKGHAGHDLNEAADERARAAATAFQQGVSAKLGPGFAGPSAVPAQGAPSSQDSSAELDLFSELASDPFASQWDGLSREPTAEATVEALERELLRPDVRSDVGRTGELLHPEFMEIGSSGRIWTRDAMMVSLEGNPGDRTDLEVLGADLIGTSAVLLTYRSYTRSGAAIRSSLWVLDSGRWRLRFHQGTAEA